MYVERLCVGQVRARHIQCAPSVCEPRTYQLLHIPAFVHTFACACTRVRIELVWREEGRESKHGAGEALDACSRRERRERACSGRGLARTEPTGTEPTGRQHALPSARAACSCVQGKGRTRFERGKISGSPTGAVSRLIRGGIAAQV